MRSISAIKFLAILGLVVTLSCSKHADPPVISTNETSKNLPVDSNYNLNPVEAKLVGTWICTDFKTERYDLDTNYLLTCDNMQRIRLRTYVFKPDRTCFTVDSFQYNYNPIFRGGWQCDGKYITIGKQKEIIIKCDADSLVTTWGWQVAGPESEGLDLYKFRYKRIK